MRAKLRLIYNPMYYKNNNKIHVDAKRPNVVARFVVVIVVDRRRRSSSFWRIISRAFSLAVDVWWR